MAELLAFSKVDFSKGPPKPPPAPAPSAVEPEDLELTAATEAWQAEQRALGLLSSDDDDSGEDVADTAASGRKSPVAPMQLEAGSNVAAAGPSAVGDSISPPSPVKTVVAKLER